MNSRTMKGVRQGYERLKQRCLTSQSSLRASHGAYRTISPSFSPVFYRINVPKDVQLRCMGFHTITEETAPSVQVLPVVLDGHIAEIQLESDIDGTSRIFRLGIDDSLDELLSQLRYDLFKDAQRMSHTNLTLLEACHAGEKISVPTSGKVFQLQVKSYPGPEASIRWFSKFAAFAAIRRELELKVERNISFDSFIEICKKHGLSQGDAWDYLEKLRDTGFLLHFPYHNDKTVRETVFLSPEEAVERLYEQYGLESPYKAYEHEETARLQSAIDATKKNISQKEQELQSLEQVAQKWTRRINTLILGGLVTGTFTYAYLTFEYLSWDIMEPITYFTASGIAIFGYWWWLFTDTDFRYEAIALEIQRLTCRFYGYDVSSFDISSVRDSLKTLYGEKRRREQDLELLENTGFDPSLVKFQRTYDRLRSSAQSDK